MKHISLYETHIDTLNLERAVEFYKSLDLKLAHIIPERRVAFFWLGDSGKKEQMLGIWEVKKEEFASKHFAFHIPLDDLKRVPEYLRARGIMKIGSFGLEPTEPVVHAWLPAASYYFSDPDGNELEYTSVLEGESRPELGAIHLSEWIRLAKTPTAQ